MLSKKWRITILLILYYSTLSFSSYGEPIHIANRIDEYTKIDTGFSLFVEGEQRLSIEEVAAPEFQGSFITSATYQKDKRHWLRVKIYVPDSLSGEYLLMQFNRLCKTIYYFPKANGKGFFIKKNGLPVPPPERAFNYPLYRDAPVHLLGGDTATIFLYLDNLPYEKMIGNEPQLYLRPFSQAHLIKQETKYSILLITVACLLLLLVYNLFIYFSTRSRAYLFYSLAFFFITITIVNNNMYTWYWLPITPKYYFVARNSIAMFSSIAGLFYLLFSLSYFKDENIQQLAYERVKKRVYIILVVFMLSSLLLVVNPWSYPIRILNYALFFCGFILVNVFAIQLMRKGNLMARYYLIANSVFIPFLLLATLQEPTMESVGGIGLIASSPLTRMSFNIGAVLQALAFSLALAARINLLRAKVATQKLEVEKEKNQRLLEVQNVIEKKNEELEVKVDKRTKSLQEANEELQVSQESLTQLNQTKDHFFAIISHDLRGPVAAFQGIAEVLDFQIKRNKTDQISEIMQEIDQSATQLNNLLDNLLRWAQSQLGGVNYHFTTIPIKVIANEAIETFGGKARAKNIQTSIRISPPELCVYADLPSVSAIIRNVWGNAMKFTENGQVVFSAQTEQDCVKICIEDTGKGMTSEQLKHIFELKSTKSTEGTQGEKGTGLGLMLCKEFAQENGGMIKISSELGKGTQVEIRLPKA